MYVNTFLQNYFLTKKRRIISSRTRNTLNQYFLLYCRYCSNWNTEWVESKKMTIMGEKGPKSQYKSWKLPNLDIYCICSWWPGHLLINITLDVLSCPELGETHPCVSYSSTRKGILSRSGPSSGLRKGLVWWKFYFCVVFLSIILTKHA